MKTIVLLRPKPGQTEPSKPKEFANCTFKAVPQGQTVIVDQNNNQRALYQTTDIAEIETVD